MLWNGGSPLAFIQAKQDIEEYARSEGFYGLMTGTIREVSPERKFYYILDEMMPAGYPLSTDRGKELQAMVIRYRQDPANNSPAFERQDGTFSEVGDLVVKADGVDRSPEGFLYGDLLIVVRKYEYYMTKVEEARVKKEEWYNKIEKRKRMLEIATGKLEGCLGSRVKVFIADKLRNHDVEGAWKDLCIQASGLNIPGTSDSLIAAFENINMKTWKDFPMWCKQAEDIRLQLLVCGHPMSENIALMQLKRVIRKSDQSELIMVLTTGRGMHWSYEEIITRLREEYAWLINREEINESKCLWYENQKKEGW